MAPRYWLGITISADTKPSPQNKKQIKTNKQNQKTKEKNPSDIKLYKTM